MFKKLLNILVIVLILLFTSFDSTFFVLLDAFASPDTITPRPDSAGDETELTPFGAAGNWDCVDEESSDDDTTYVYTTNSEYLNDLYNLADPSITFGAINSVTAFMKCRSILSPTQSSAYTRIKINGEVFNGSPVTLTPSYTDYSTTYNNNPQTGNPWTWTDITNLQVGVGLRRARTTGALSDRQSRCTQVWVTVDYEPTINVGTSGTQSLNLTIPSTNNYLGGAFTFIRNSGTASVTQIVISETGTVNANLNLSNLKLYYETAASCSYEGNETLFGVATLFNSSEKATVTGTMSVGTSQVCVYPVLDVGSNASNGQTLEIEISNPSTDVTVSAGTVSPTTPQAIAGTTTLIIPNTAPVIDLESVAQETDGSKWVRINYTGTDAENNSCSLVTYQYSQDNTTWYTMTEKSGVGSNGTTNLPFTSQGASLMFAWDVNANLSNTVDNTVYIRLKPNDGTVDGDLKTSSAFACDTKDPTVAQAVHLESTPVSGNTSFQLDTAFLEDNPNTNEFDYDLNGAGYAGWQAGDSNVADPSPKTFSVSLDGDDWFNAIKAKHTDDFGNQIVSEDTTNIYVTPLTPDPPTVTNEGLSTLRIKVNPNLQEAGNVKYAIQVTSPNDPSWNGRYVSASYSPSSTPVWQTYSEWGGASGFLISDLMAVQYCFKAKASNPSDVTNSTTSSFSLETCQTVDQYLSFTISSNSTSFGDLSPSFISTSTPNIVLTVTTNAQYGYEIRVKDEGNQIDTSGLYNLEDNYLITSSTATLSPGTEGYGIQASSTTATIAALYNKSGNDVGGLLRTLTLLASNTGPVTNETITIIHKAAISTLTPAGSYADTITYTCTANY